MNELSEKEMTPEAKRLLAQNNKIVWGLVALSILVLAFWILCAYLKGQNIWTKSQASIAMVLSGVLLLMVGLGIGVILDKNLQCIRKSASDSENAK